MNYSNKSIFSDFQRFTDKNILVIGDLMLDRYIWGSAKRISPEAPVPVIDVNRIEDRLGGAGNVASNLAGLGCGVTLAGFIGEDEDGDKLLSQLNTRSLNHKIIRSRNIKTTTKSRIIAQRQQIVRFDEERVADVSLEAVDDLLESVGSEVETVDGVILSDYKKGALCLPLINGVKKIFKDKPVLIDPKGRDYDLYKSVTAIKPNFNEFKDAVRNPDLHIQDIEPAARELIQQLKIRGLVVTLGENGVFVINPEGRSMTIPTMAREVFDVSGAGDTFVAAFLGGLLVTQDWFKAASLGNIASGIAVGKVGTSAVVINDIRAYLFS